MPPITCSCSSPGSCVSPWKGKPPVDVGPGEALSLKGGVMHTFINTGKVAATIVEVFGKAPAAAADLAAAKLAALARARSRSVIRVAATPVRSPLSPLSLPASPGPSIEPVFMASLIEAIEIKRKMFFEFEGAPYHCIDVEVSKPTARGGQTLVRLKMRNLLSRAVFDKTFKAGEKFAEPDLVQVPATYQYSDGDAYFFMEDGTFETLSLSADTIGDDKGLLVDNVIVKVQKFNGNPIAVEFPAHIEMTIADTEEGARGNTASGSVTKVAVTETGLKINVPLFIKTGERVKVHTETRDFAGRA